MRLSVFVFFPLLLAVVSAMILPTMAWVIADRQVSAHSGMLTARHTDFVTSITILPCTDTVTADDHAQAENVMHLDSRYTGLSAGDTYEIRVTVCNRAQIAKHFNITFDNLSMIGADGESFSTDIFLIGVPTDDSGAVSYFAEVPPTVTEDGWQYFPCTALGDGAPAAAVRSLASGAELAMTFRIRLRTDTESSGVTAEMLSGAVFRIGQISVRDTTPKT